MKFELNLIISILKLTKKGPVSAELVKKDAMIQAEFASKLLRNFQVEGLVYLRKDILEADNTQRFRLAVRAIQQGADIETVSSFLEWKEFEQMAAIALERNDFAVRKNVRFRHAGRRWEIDIVGCKRPTVVCIDCKHWRHGISPSVLKKVVEEQVERTSALAKEMPSPTLNIECASWDDARFVPAVLLLTTGRFKFYYDVPIIPILQLQDFLSQLPAYANSLKHFTKTRTNQRIL